METAYRGLERRLRAQAAPGSVLISCHPVLAAVADRDGVGRRRRRRLGRLADRGRRHLRPAGGAMGWSYAQMAEADVNVITVSQTIADRIGARRSTVVPNGVDSARLRLDLPVPDWFAAIDGPVALWVGAVEGRIGHRGARRVCPRARPEWSGRAGGTGHRSAPRAGPGRLPNVVITGWHPRPRCWPWSTPPGCACCPTSQRRDRGHEPAQAVRVPRGRYGDRAPTCPVRGLRPRHPGPARRAVRPGGLAASPLPRRDSRGSPRSARRTTGTPGMHGSSARPWEGQSAVLQSTELSCSPGSASWGSTHAPSCAAGSACGPRPRRPS